MSYLSENSRSHLQANKEREGREKKKETLASKQENIVNNDHTNPREPTKPHSSFSPSRRLLKLH